VVDTTEVVLGDATFQLRPLFPALEAISIAYGGIVGATSQIQEYNVSAMADIMCQFLKANGHGMKKADVGSRMVEVGLASHVPPLLELLTNAITAGPEEPTPLGDAKSREGA